MKLKKFIKKFVEPNTLIRLQYKIVGGHREVLSNPLMEHELLKSEFANRRVIGVTDIVIINSHYPEAVNITINTL